MSTAPKPRQTWQEFLDSAGGMSRRQRVVVLLTFLAMVTEGLDISIASFVYPEIVRDWGTSLGAITTTVTAGVLAMAIGSVLAGPFADRYGRRNTIVAGMLLFGTTTAAMGLTTSIEPLMILRVTACLGLGGTVPVLLAVVADAVPSGRRAQMVSLAFCGVAVGTIVGGFLASAIIPVWGWPALLVSCGLAPLCLVPAIVLLVPDAPGVLIARGRPIAEARRALASLVPGRDLSTVSFAAPAGTGPRRRVSGATVLTRHLAFTTVLLWLAFFIGLGVAFLILNYLPLMVRQQNFSAAQTGVIIGTFGWGAFIGQVLVSFALKRFDRFLVVASLWALGLAGLFVVAAFTFGFAGLLLIVFGLGLSLASVSAALNAIGAVAYPPAARATGMGWANGAGRLGTLASGLLGGLMLTAGWTIDMIFLAMGVPVAVGIAAALLLRADDRRRRRRDTAPPSVRRPAPAAE